MANKTGREEAYYEAETEKHEKNGKRYEHRWIENVF